MSELKDNLKHIRKRKGLTQKDLAFKIDATPQIISNIERGYTQASHGIIKQLAVALSCSVEDLIGDTDVSPDYEMIMFSDKSAFDALPKEERNRILNQLQEQADFLIERAKKNI
ncbi:helix-turn-helix transcriptional regulator [Mammaliicoccus sciuri]|uniref:helix-turn-helix domain-containing protein n=1 Tax=Mammaliicoccus sciuri TaxID=1296 RepID=UPI001D0D7062|nr:helix-turn-helix transcriptional regulator [Mammaliicoccus sciuri]MCC2087952.1 helix-turn-helix transcriptional regulator [Mammaliicoccus sciuri]